MEEVKRVRLHVFITGTVQGVGFRAFVQRQAYRWNITGWVRNCWDGSVELAAEGLEPDLRNFLGAIYQGPRGAYVAGVEPEWQDATGEFTGFQVRSTAERA